MKKALLREWCNLIFDAQAGKTCPLTAKHKTVNILTAFTTKGAAKEAPFEFYIDSNAFFHEAKNRSDIESPRR